MDAALVASLEKLVSTERFQRYRIAGANDLEAATLYLWNIELTGALLPAIAILEVGLRNAVHASLTKKAGKEYWFESELQKERWRNVEEIILKLEQVHGPSVPSGKVLAELTFGMWPHLFSSSYKHLWWNPPDPRLAEILPNHAGMQPSVRKEFARRLHYFNNLRNRAMHHEPVFQGVGVVNLPHLPVEALHAQLIETIGWIDTDAAAIVSCIDRFPLVFSTTGKQTIETALRTTFNLS